MRLELGSRVDCSDGVFGELVDVVIDPTTRRITHLVVEPNGEPWSARLVPVELTALGGDDGAILVRASAADIRGLEPVQEVRYLRLDGFPVEDPDWEVGIQEVFALPYYPAYDLEPLPIDYAVMYDRIPKSEVEIRRASAVYSADGHLLGRVDGFLVDRDSRITHVVLEHGHLWGRREITVPVGAVARVESDTVTLKLTKDEVGELPEVAVQRWPTLPAKGPPRLRAR